MKLNNCQCNNNYKLWNSSSQCKWINQLFEALDEALEAKLNLVKLNVVKMFALQNSSAMGAAVTPWSSTMMMDRISLDDMPHKGRGNILS